MAHRKRLPGSRVRDKSYDQPSFQLVMRVRKDQVDHFRPKRKTYAYVTVPCKKNSESIVHQTSHHIIKKKVTKHCSLRKFN